MLQDLLIAVALIHSSIATGAHAGGEAGDRPKRATGKMFLGGTFMPPLARTPIFALLDLARTGIP